MITEVLEFGAIGAGVLYEYLIQKHFETNHYDIDIPDRFSQFDGLTLAVVTDLHNHVYGADNEELLTAIADSKPDLIVIPGDLVVGPDVGNLKAYRFIKHLAASKIPIYYSLGNHEERFQTVNRGVYHEYVRRLKAFGVHVLDNEAILAECGMRIAGISIPMTCYQKFAKEEAYTLLQMQKDLKLEKEDEVFTLLLAHNPVYFRKYAALGADLVVSGHMHGGIARLPHLGGVISPQAKLFPEYDAGIFREEHAVLAVSRGLGVHTIPVRVWNKPELMILHLRAR